MTIALLVLNIICAVWNIYTVVKEPENGFALSCGLFNTFVAGGLVGLLIGQNGQA